MKTSGHFCPYPFAYTALACRARQATSCGQNSHLAREDGLIQGRHERRLSLPAAPRLAAVSRGSRPRETGLKTPPMHKQVPVFEPGDYGNHKCTRFRTTI